MIPLKSHDFKSKSHDFSKREEEKVKSEKFQKRKSRDLLFNKMI